MKETIAQQIIRHEGMKHHPYTDTVGKTTIGVGRNLDDRGLSEPEILFLLGNDINLATWELRARFLWFGSLDERRQNVLINMCFNMGIRRLSGFRRMIAALEVGDYAAAADEMLDSKWARQVGDRANELSTIMRYG